MDLTTLNDDDTDEKVIALCHRPKLRSAIPPLSYLSSLYPDCSQNSERAGHPEIRIATVTNFPHGNDDIDIALAETRAAIAYGADELTWCSRTAR
ncbi:hypothetical protein ACNKHM_08095 [Shigella sonnei]